MANGVNREAPAQPCMETHDGKFLGDASTGQMQISQMMRDDSHPSPFPLDLLEEPTSSWQRCAISTFSGSRNSELGEYEDSVGVQHCPNPAWEHGTSRWDNNENLARPCTGTLQLLEIKLRN